MKNIEDFRKSYRDGKLEANDLNGDPIEQFRTWWHDAVAAEILEPNAMTLATVNADGRPTARIVLLKGISEGGFEFYTNYQSQKARDIESNSKVALVFLWKELERQVRIEGVAQKVSKEKSHSYFQSRPRGSQISAWASPQSEIIPNRDILENKVSEITLQYSHLDPLPLPEFWGGYIVEPHVIEFWQGRPDRMHDRIRYSKNKKGENWSIDRLAP